jgi:hypothetical protein
MSNQDLLGSGGTFTTTFEAIRTAGRQVSVALAAPGRSYTGWVFRTGSDWVVLRQDIDNKSDTTDVMIPFAAISYVDIVGRAYAARDAV